MSVYAQLSLLGQLKTCSRCGRTKTRSEFYAAPSARDGLRGECKACCSVKQSIRIAANPERKRTRDRAYYQAHRAANAITHKAWYAKNRDACLRRNRDRYQDKKDIIADQIKEWQAAHPEKVREIKRASAERHREKTRMRKRERYAENPAYSRAKSVSYYHNRRARLKKVGGRFTSAEWRDLIEHYGNRCLCCGVSGEEVTLTADHVVPVACGGSNNISNIQPLCKSCNCRKAKLSTDYRVASAPMPAAGERAGRA